MGTENIPKSNEAVGAECPSDLELQIIRQIEYYFGNFNLSKDKFLREQIKLDDGWIPLETMVKFNRLKKLSDDFSVITEALKKSPKQLMEISDDCKKIRRRSLTSFPEDFQSRKNEIEERTLYVKGFKKNSSLDDLLDFFKDFGVENIYMRKNVKQNNKPFKGSVFVTFEEKEDAEKFLVTKGIKFNGTELLKEWKKDYVKRKDELYKMLREEKEKKLLKKAGMLKEDKKENGDQENSNTGDENDVKDMVRGCLLKLSNLNKDCSRELIKAAFESHGKLVFVDYHYGNPTGVIRFDSAVAQSVLEKLPQEDGIKKIDISSSKAEVSAIEGDEEEEYWKLISKSRFKARQALSVKRNKNSGKQGRFKKWGKRQKGKDDDDKDDIASELPTKKMKSESDENTNTDVKVSSDTTEVTPDVSTAKVES